MISVKGKIFLIILGVFLGAVLLELGLRTAGGIFLFLQEYRNRISIKHKGTYRIMCLGESTTAFGGNDAYPQQLEEVLNQQNIGIKFSVINKGVSSDTSTILSQLENNLDCYRPNMVIAMMGINDCGETKAYDDVFNKKNTKFTKTLQIYKLINLLKVHIVNKVKQKGIYMFKKHITSRACESSSSRGETKPILLLSRFRNAISDNSDKYLILGGWYYDQGKYAQAEEMFKKAIKINPCNIEAYNELGMCYTDQGRYDRAEEMFKKVIAIEPNEHHSYQALGFWYWTQKKYAQAEEIFKKAFEINPKDEDSYIDIGWWYGVASGLGEYDKAEEMIKKAIEINPLSDFAYCSLGDCYFHQEKYAQAEEMFKRAIEINPWDTEGYGALALCYQAQGKCELAGEYFREANELETCNPITCHNYQKLQEITAKRKIVFVCMQYPMRDVKILKKMFLERKDIIFIDNQRVFKKALEQGKIGEYFSDMFGGNFGHCTKKGNRLLAENIANVILKESFNK